MLKISKAKEVRKVRATERRQAILEAVCDRRFEKVDNLAFEFGVHRNTILNDVLELSLSYPIYTKTGRHDGGVYVAEDYHLGKRYLTPEEKELLEVLLPGLGDDQRKVMESIIRKFGRPRKQNNGRFL